MDRGRASCREWGEGGGNFFLEGKEDFKEGKYSGNSGSKNPEEEK